MRVTYKAEEGQYKALVRGRNMHGEFEVDFYVDGVVQAPARYYTEDRGDAEGTAEAWVALQASDQARADSGREVAAVAVVGAGDAVAAG